MTYCENLYHYQRRLSREVIIGSLKMGGAHPIRVQSMLTSDTMNTQACVQEALGLVKVGCELVRITAPTVKDAANLKNIKAGLRAAGCEVPLVADIHFKPEAAVEAALWVEKVRINPGNFADSKKFNVREYSDQEYAAELERIRERFTPLVQRCQDRGVAMRIGTNHGSLSDRIMNRFGDTPLGMVESALEFAQIARDLGFHQFVFSMKASNPKVMIAAYRLLVARLNKMGEDWNYPIHLGVTEAGDGEDGRIKSAIGIGSLLADGIGDTIRVSLTEDSEHEIPVAKALIEGLKMEDGSWKLEESRSHVVPTWPLFEYQRRASKKMIVESCELSGTETVRVVVPRSSYQAVAHKLEQMGEYQPELIFEKLSLREIDPRSEEEVATLQEKNNPQLVTVRDGIELDPIAAFRLLAARIPVHHPILLKDTLHPEKEVTNEFVRNLLAASTVIGSLLCDGIGDAIFIRRETAPGASLRLAYNILQAAGVRIFKTDYVACPSCGRTLFNLQETTARIKAATGHLKGVRIAIMGCIVNGPGEMADADFGYVGGAPGKINLYVGKKAVKFNIPQEEAVERLVGLIREHGKWVDSC
ncbi:MAG: (E)-4-hydroxy-3-methylbut-2-enyl-diphosphate synthase [Chthoniobacterales bacterium]|nr:(E)-4-hydroxy-3-methylbut-2-enyl-diphosphate synthase [Chthoniobacterales bacterium]